jgi:hypothetical protein
MDGKTIYSISLKIDMASSWQQLPAIEKKEKVGAEKKRVLLDQSTLVQRIPLPPFLFGTSIFEVDACFSGLKCF